MYAIAEDRFKLIVPAILMAKSLKDGGGSDRYVGDEGETEHPPTDVSRIIEGPASRPVKDMQGETVHPSGLDLSYFRRHGRINWDHGKRPQDIIGQPLDWKLTKDEFFLRAVLYHGIEFADHAYKLFLQGATLAWSVEGRVIERDKTDPTQVLRAYVINVALTPNPVCQDTFARLAKAPTDAEVKKALSTTTGAALIEQSIEGDDKPHGRYHQPLAEHLERALSGACDCIRRGANDAGTFIRGYAGAMSHFYGCCGASPDLASDLAGRYIEIAAVTGRVMKGA